MKGMHKRVGKVFGLVLTLLVFASPMFVKADQLTLKTNAYSTTITTGSEFTFVMEVNQNNFQGVVNFDGNILEFVDVKTEYAGESGVYGGSLGTVNKEVSNNTININYTKGDNPVTLLITFKAKSVPANGKTTIKVVPSGYTWFGQPESTVTIVAAKECQTSDGTECPVCETCTESDETASNSKDSNDILLYGSLGVYGVLAIAVIVLAVKKK